MSEKVEEGPQITLMSSDGVELATLDPELTDQIFKRALESGLHPKEYLNHAMAEAVELAKFMDLKEVFDLQKRNRKVSPYTAGRNALQFAQEVVEEAGELVDEIEPSHGEEWSEEALDELGDTIGAFMLLMNSVSYFHVRKAVNLQIEKYRRRKPWIFEDFEGEMPESIREEYDRWQEAKRKEKEE